MRAVQKLRVLSTKFYKNFTLALPSVYPYYAIMVIVGERGRKDGENERCASPKNTKNI